MGALHSQDPLADFLASCPELLFSAREDSTIVRLSGSLAALLGPEVNAEAKLAERVHLDDRRAFDAAWSAVTGGAASLPFTFRLTGEDGKHRLVSCRARRSDARGEIHGSLRDAEAEEEAALLRVVEGNIPITVWAIDRQGIFVHHAGKGAEAAGLKPGQLLGMNIFELYRGGPGVSKVEQAFEGQVGHTISKQHETHWETWYMPFRDVRGEITKVAGVTLDISASKRAEAELRDKLELIERQREVIRALSTPIIEVWEKVLTLPMVGVIDSVRAAEMMANLLARVSEKGARFVLLDLTGVEMIDSGTAAHLIKLVEALGLLGAEGVITGVRPVVAQTMVTLGVDLERVVTRSNLRDGLRYCIRRMREGGG